MAISYSLDLATPLSASKVALALRECAAALGMLGGDSSADQLLEEGVVTPQGTWMRAGGRIEQSRGRAWDLLVGGLVFDPTAWVYFRLRKPGAASDGLATQQDHMIRLTLGLLDVVPGDAVLHFDYETVWLVRREGVLSLSDRQDLWTLRRLAMVRPPYRRGKHWYTWE
ncbi:SitI3 family protein [Amycolatopsis sp. cmx-11-12]|uniref:SitI3 family protein n=1 Tax=Amycolatopsis sp. cmx-11-12 TaxID=2785795 RepID=UPI0039185084